MKTNMGKANSRLGWAVVNRATGKIVGWHTQEYMAEAEERNQDEVCDVMRAIVTVSKPRKTKRNR